MHKSGTGRKKPLNPKQSLVDRRRTARKSTEQIGDKFGDIARAIESGTRLLYRYHELAELLGETEQAITRLVDAGELRRVYVSRGQARITAESALAYLRRKKAK